MKALARWTAKGTLLLAVVMGWGCRERLPTDPDFADDAVLVFRVNTPSYVRRVSIEITGPGIGSPIVYNVSVVNDTASGTLTVPPGASRHILANAFDSAEVNTHRGDTTLTLNAGANPTLRLTLRPLSAELPVVIRFGSDYWQVTNFPDLSPYGDYVSTVAVNASDHLFAAVRDAGVYRSTDNGATWTQVNSGLTTTDAHMVAAASNGDLYLGTQLAGVFRSTDNGLTWVQTALSGVTASFMFAIGNSIYALDGYLCTGIYRSRDNGASWTSLNNGLSSKCVNALAVTSAGHLVVATGTGGMFRSTDDGGSWNAANTGLGSTNLYHVVIAPNGDIYAGSSVAGVYRSTDNGDSWSAVNGNLPVSRVHDKNHALAVNAAGHLFVGLLGLPGVYRSTDNGTSWQSLNSGLNSSSPDGVGVVFQSTGHAVANDSRLIWRSTAPTTPSP